MLKKWSFPTKIHTVVALQNRRNRRGDQFPYFVKSVNALSIRGWGQFIPTTLILAHPNFHTFLRSLTKMHTCARESPKLSVCTRKQYHNEIHMLFCFLYETKRNCRYLWNPFKYDNHYCIQTHCIVHSMARANLNKSVWLVTNITTASMYIPKRTRNIN